MTPDMLPGIPYGVKKPAVPAGLALNDAHQVRDKRSSANGFIGSTVDNGLFLTPRAHRAVSSRCRNVGAAALRRWLTRRKCIQERQQGAALLGGQRLHEAQQPLIRAGNLRIARRDGLTSCRSNAGDHVLPIDSAGRHSGELVARNWSVFLPPADRLNSCVAQASKVLLGQAEAPPLLAEAGANTDLEWILHKE